MATYDISRPTITDDDGTGETGTLFDNAFWNDDVFDAIDAVFDLVEADVEALQTQGYLKGYDSVVYEYKDAATVTLQASGQFTSSDSTAFYTIAANTDCGFAANLSSDVGGGEASSTLYYIWGGEDSGGDLEFWISDSATVMPSELVKGKRLRGAIYNDGSSNILLFIMTQESYLYNVAIAVAGSDATEVLDATVSPSAWTEIDWSSFVPPGIESVEGICYWYQNSVYTVDTGFYIRREGETHNGFLVTQSLGPSSGQCKQLVPFVLDSDLKCEVKYKNNTSQTARVSALRYYFN